MSSGNNSSAEEITKGMKSRYLAFSLNHEEYAIPLLQVKEVIGMLETTPIPQTPKYFKGIINLRGQVISVIDLRMKLQIEKDPKEVYPETSIIILDLNQMSLGMIVDSINSVMILDEKDLAPIPESMGRETSYLLGVARQGEHLTLVLDMPAILNEQDVVALRRQVNNKEKQAA